MNRNTADTIVIGGGIAGASIALRLVERGQRVILLDKGAVGEEASGRNAGGVRQQDRDPAELPLAMEAVKIWADMGDELECDVEYRRGGNIIIPRSPEDLVCLQQSCEREKAAGLRVAMLSPEETLEVTPTVPEKFAVSGSKFCPTDGIANPLLVVKAICRKARRKGLRIMEHEPVRRLEATGGCIRSAVTDRGEYQGGTFVNAAGPWARALCNTVGFDFPAEPARTRLLVTEAIPPMVRQFVDFGEVYYRQALSGNIHIGPGESRANPDFSKEALLDDFASLGRWVDTVMPFLKNVAIIRAFAGVTCLSPDRVAILDRVPGFDNLFLTTGFSGHGFCLGPIVGRLLAEWIVDGKSSMDLSAMRVNRFDSPP